MKVILKIENLPKTKKMTAKQVMMFLPGSSSLFWRRVKAGKFPQPEVVMTGTNRTKPVLMFDTRKIHDFLCSPYFLTYLNQ